MPWRVLPDIAAILNKNCYRRDEYICKVSVAMIAPIPKLQTLGSFTLGKMMLVVMMTGS